MKSFKSTKNLKPLDISTKQQNILRSRIKLLQQQVQRLQQVNLNINIPISQHTVNSSIDYQGMINKLKTKIVNLQNDNSSLKNQVKRLEKQKDSLKIEHQKQIKMKNQQIEILKEDVQQLKDLKIQLQEILDQRTHQLKIKQKENIELNVQIKFIKQDLEEIKKLSEFYKQKLQQSTKQISAVKYSSKIYKSLTTSITAIETQQIEKLKKQIWKLQKELRQLKQSLKSQIINLGIPKHNIGQEIVRLKKNIDLQLGLKCGNQNTQAFLNTYNQTNDLFKKLIQQCRK